MTIIVVMKNNATKCIAAGEFKAKCLALLDHVNQTREPVVVTKRGKPIAKLVPVSAEPGSLLGSAKGTIRYAKDDNLFSTGEAWDAEA